MKKLKSLCAIVGAAMIYAAPSFAQDKKINVPEHDPAAALKKIEIYGELTPMGPEEVAKDDLKEGKKYNKQTFYLFDRDKDGKVDLLRLEMSQPELKIKDVEGYLEQMKQVYGEDLKQFYGEDYINFLSNTVIQQATKQVYLAIDEEHNGGYDGFVERMAMDLHNEKGEPFADGIFDQEKYVSPKIESYSPK